LVCNQCGIDKELTEFYPQHKYNKKRGNYIYYNPKCKTCSSKNATQWGIDNPEKKKASRRKENKKKKRKENKKQCYDRYKEQGKIKIYYAENPDKFREYNKNRKAKNHKIKTKQWAACKQYFNNACAYCGMTIKEHKKQYKTDLHREHAIYNGADDLSNCVPSCHVCNSQKNIYDFTEWYTIKNEKFSQERLDLINRWLSEDYKKCM
jgi:hypothetical protein